MAFSLLSLRYVSVVSLVPPPPPVLPPPATQILKQFPQISLSRVLELVHAHLQTTGGAKGAEEKGACFGRGFALLALVRSGVLTSEVSGTLEQ